MKCGGHMLRFERSLTSYIAILEYKFVSIRPKNNNYDSKSCPLNSVGNFSIKVEHVQDLDFLIARKLGEVCDGKFQQLEPLQ